MLQFASTARAGRSRCSHTSALICERRKILDRGSGVATSIISGGTEMTASTTRRAAHWALAVAAGAATTAGGAADAAPIFDPANNVTYVKDATVQSWTAARAAAQA